MTQKLEMQQNTNSMVFPDGLENDSGNNFEKELA